MRWVLKDSVVEFAMKGRLRIVEGVESKGSVGEVEEVCRGKLGRGEKRGKKRGRGKGRKMKKNTK